MLRQKSFQISFLIAKTLVTASLIVFLLSAIIGDYNRIKVRSLNRFSWSDLIVDHEKVKARAMVVTLNHLIPSFDGIVELMENRGRANGERLKEYINYYQQIVEYIPQNADAYGMLGFCYYYLGKHEEALASYKKAAQFNPHSFWF